MRATICHSNMKHTVAAILNDELTVRLVSYANTLKSADPEEYEAIRAELNHRYLCLQTALYIEQGGKEPAISKTIEEIHAELRRWMREIQRTATVNTQYQAGRTIALLSEWIEQTKTITAAPAQTSLL
jgi:hypothetical protein